jgi:hypothetical protein
MATRKLRNMSTRKQKSITVWTINHMSSMEHLPPMMAAPAVSLNSSPLIASLNCPPLGGDVEDHNDTTTNTNMNTSTNTSANTSTNHTTRALILAQITTTTTTQPFTEERPLFILVFEFEIVPVCIHIRIRIQIMTAKIAQPFKKKSPPVWCLLFVLIRHGEEEPPLLISFFWPRYQSMGVT